MAAFQGGSRDGAINRSMDGMDEIHIEPAPSEPRFNPAHRRSFSWSENLTTIPESPSPRLIEPGISGQSESQGLLPNTPRNLFEYTTTNELKGFGPPKQEDEARGSSPLGGLPQTLCRTQRERWADLVVDFFAVSATLPFFALGGALIWANGNEVDEYQEKDLQQLILVAGTMFPLVFSVVVGRAVVKLASWKLEKGASLGSLERLMGSRTVGGTLITQFKLGSITLAATGLILLWLFSPMGGQAVLRILSITDGSSNSDSSNALYVSMRQASFAGSPIFNSWFSGFASLFTSSLLAPEQVKNSTTDLWGNAKLPRFASLANIAPDVNGWRQIPKAGKSFTPSYSSLFGVPISGIPAGNTTFSLESSYIDLNCANVTSNIARKDNVFYDPGLIGTGGPFRSAQNITSSTSWALGYLGEDVSSRLPNISSQHLDSLPTTIVNQTFLPGILLYQDFTGRFNVASIYCVPSRQYIESQVFCTRTTKTSTPHCNVTAQRLSLQQHMPTTLTPLSFTSTLLGLTDLLPQIAPPRTTIDLVQNYLVNPLSNSFIQSTTSVGSDTSDRSSNRESRFLSLPLSVFSIRLSQILNTFLQGSALNSTSYLTNFDPSFSTPSIAALTTSSQVQSGAPIIATNATTTTFSRKEFTISTPFLSLFLLSTTLMLVSALASAWLARHTLARDYLPYISSFLRDSRHLNFPTGGVMLDGFERSRIMRNLRIRLGDVGQVEGGWEVGTGVRVRVGRVGVGLEEATVKLKRGRRKKRRGRLYL